MTIYENIEKELTIELTNEINTDIQTLLWEMKWGTNGPIYQKISNAEKDENIFQPYFMQLKKSGELIGMCTVSKRPIWFGEEERRAYIQQLEKRLLNQHR